MKIKHKIFTFLFLAILIFSFGSQARADDDVSLFDFSDTTVTVAVGIGDLWNRPDDPKDKMVTVLHWEEADTLPDTLPDTISLNASNISENLRPLMDNGYLEYQIKGLKSATTYAVALYTSTDGSRLKRTTTRNKLNTNVFITHSSKNKGGGTGTNTGTKNDTDSGTGNTGGGRVNWTRDNTTDSTATFSVSLKSLYSDSADNKAPLFIVLHWIETSKGAFEKIIDSKTVNTSPNIWASFDKFGNAKYTAKGLKEATNYAVAVYSGVDSSRLVKNPDSATELTFVTLSKNDDNGTGGQGGENGTGQGGTGGGNTGQGGGQGGDSEQGGGNNNADNQENTTDNPNKTNVPGQNDPPSSSDGENYKFLAALPIIGDSINPNDGLGDYLSKMIQFIIALTAALAVIKIILGGVQYMSTDAFSEKAQGKESITNAIIGLLIALGAFALLNTINPNLVNNNVSIKGASLSVDPESDNDPTDAFLKAKSGDNICPNKNIVDANGKASPIILGEPWFNDGSDTNMRQILGFYKIYFKNPVACTTAGQNNCLSMAFNKYAPGTDKKSVASAIQGKLIDLKTLIDRGGFIESVGQKACSSTVTGKCALTITGASECWKHSTHTPEKPNFDFRVDPALTLFVTTKATSANLATGNKAAVTFTPTTVFPSQCIRYTVPGVGKFLAEIPKCTKKTTGAHWHVELDM